MTRSENTGNETQRGWWNIERNTMKRKNKGTEKRREGNAKIRNSKGNEIYR